MGVFNVASIEISPLVANQQNNSFALIKKRLEGRLTAYLGKPLWQLNIDEITKEVKKESWVRELRISRSIPNRVQLRIDPKETAALLLKKEGGFVPVGIDGSLLSHLEKGKSPDAPFLTGEKMRKDASLRQRAVEILGSLPEKGFFSRESISELMYLPKKGFVAIINQGGYEVLLGQKLGAEKRNQVDQVLNYIQTKSVRARVIDARLSKKVLVRLRKQP